jgi:protein-S-isoprenylcysteine O-methyltransferase Ste14
MRWKWVNIPIPESYVLALVAGVLLRFLKPYAITTVQWLVRVIGAPLLLVGLVLAGWSVAAAGEVSLEKPTVLLTSGPYRFSRNPMYVAWTSISLGLALLVNSVWLVGALPLAFLYLHLVEIPRDEASLEEMFGEEYLSYKRRVRRYL